MKTIVATHLFGHCASPLRTPNLMILLLLLFLLFVSDCHCTATTSTITIHTHSKTNRNNNANNNRKQKYKTFEWSCKLNPTNGRCTSHEQSSFPFFLSIPSRRLFYSQHRALQSTAKEMFESYPRWLSLPRVTLGLLRTLPSFHATTAAAGSVVKDCLFGGEWLSFGVPESRFIKKRVRVMIKDGTGEDESVRTVEQTCVGVETRISILGGRLVRGAATSPPSSSLPYFGYLLFDAIPVPFQDGPQRRKMMMMVETGIVGYPPAIAGDAPVHPLRGALYQSTQAVLHAYVMWRFHRHVRFQWNQKMQE